MGRLAPSVRSCLYFQEERQIHKLGSSFKFSIPSIMAGQLNPILAVILSLYAPIGRLRHRANQTCNSNLSSSLGRMIQHPSKQRHPKANGGGHLTIESVHASAPTNRAHGLTPRSSRTQPARPAFLFRHSSFNTSFSCRSQVGPRSFLR